MDILQSRYYRFNVRMLTLIGQWPYQEPKCQRIQRILFHLCVMTVMLTQGIKLVEVWGDLDTMIECLTPMGVQLNACVKSLNCIVNRDKMTKLLETIKRDWSNFQREDEIKILAKHAAQGQKLNFIYIIYLYGSMGLYLLVPLVPRILDVILPRNESREHSYLYQTQYFIDPEEYFYPILLHTYTGTIITITIVIAVDAMFVSYVHHICGVLEIIGHRLENLMKTHNAKVHRLYDDDERYRELVRCIEQHSGATEFAKLIENAYSIAFLIQVAVSMLLLSLSAVQLLMKLGQSEEMIRLLQFNLAQFLHILFNSWPGQKLLDQSVRFRDSVYCTEWYLLSMRSKMLLRIIMLRTIDPLKITAGKLYVLSMENFGAMIRASVSYFTVFASLR